MYQRNTTDGQRSNWVFQEELEKQTAFKHSEKIEFEGNKLDIFKPIKIKDVSIQWLNLLKMF